MSFDSTNAAHNGARTLVEALRAHVGAGSFSANRRAFTFLQDGETVSRTIDYTELDHAVRGVAAHLQRLTEPGDRVLLLFPPSIDFTIAFFGCLYAGCVAVPAIPPTGSRHVSRLQHIVDDAGARVALTIHPVWQRICALKGQGKSLLWLSIDQLDDASSHWCDPGVSPDALAFLQYTSGSTGTAKGVMVRHENVLANLHYGESVLGGGVEGSTGVSWLPQHHDFGLIASVVGTVYTGSHCVQMPPFAVLMQPALWLRAVTQFRARVIGAPNFAYDLCTRRITQKQKRDIDLSSLELAINGSEPVRQETLRRFGAAFAECGFDPKAFTIGYGLAESTLLVSANRKQRQADGLPLSLALAHSALHRHEIAAPNAGEPASEFVCVGSALTNHEIVVVDADAEGTGHESARIGEVWVRGPSVAAGYWGREIETAEVFGARISGREGRYMRTGDLGFVQDGGLYITGRIKELMIFGGKNVYPHDLEASFSALSSRFVPFGCAAFSMDDGSDEALALVQELAYPDASGFGDELVAQARATLLDAHGVAALRAIVLVRAGALPRTTSGKIQRTLCSRLLREDRFHALWQWRAGSAPKVEALVPRTPLQAQLLELCSECLGGESIGLDDDYHAAGLHSIFAAQLIVRLNTALGIELPLDVLFRAPTLRELAQKIERLQSRGAASAVARLVRLDRRDDLPLSSAQKRMWFLDRLRPGAADYVMPLALRISGELDVSAFRTALQALAERHEVLRTVFVDSPDGPRQRILPHGDLVLEVIEACGADLPLRVQVEAARGFDLERGPVGRAMLLQNNGCEHVLLICLHHIVADGWSVGVLMRELAQLYASALERRPFAQPELTFQYAEFAAWHNRYLESERFQTDLAWWGERLANVRAMDLPLDFARPKLPSGLGGMCVRHIDESLLRDVDELAARVRGTRYMVLLAAFFILLQRYTGQEHVSVGTPVANRLRAEFEPLIGFFANTLIMRGSGKSSQSFIEHLNSTREEVLSALSHQAVPFDAMVALCSGRRLFDVMFVLQNAFDSSQTLPGLECEPLLVHNGSAKFDLTLNIVPQGRALAATFEYSKDVFVASTIDMLSTHYLDLLRALMREPYIEVSAHELTLQEETT